MRGCLIKNRLRHLNDVEHGHGNQVIYIMSRDQRADDNHALLAAQEYAIERQLPLLVVFCLYPAVRHRNSEQYRFMLAGLQDVEQRLRARRIGFRVLTGKPHKHLGQLDPSAVFTDFSPLRGPRALRSQLARDLACPLFEVDTHNVVPAWVTSDKEEYAARTIRPKIHRLLDDYLCEPPALKKHPYPMEAEPVDWHAAGSAMKAPAIDGYSPDFTPGARAAKLNLRRFLHERLARYNVDRNDPTLDGLSNVSPWLHFGHISSLRIALEVEKWREDNPGHDETVDAYLEELIVRKELSDNFCLYNRNYDSFDGIRDWARTTLEDHLADEREFLYTFNELEAADTHDDAWNAAQIEMMRTGKMHGYMRMYWAKKLLEWTEHPAIAIDHAIALNDTWSLDGYDPNGYTGILWSIGGIHDRAWAERPVFGKIRYMNANGLKRKFNVQEYIDRWVR